ncbi:glycosyltransferase family 4 protein [Spirosoma radiotolerans]|uniref:glycosyltransferase family 4 protein n=1 Tax=Spirosoma radiotolerans TaxID=1379870 RepID=UPI0006974CD5|nr:glycosyltransferase family 4 protein [Spirosoma radiotolerans]
MRIICIHQSAELYGSDRSFLQVIKYLKLTNKFSEICVVVPCQGLLINELLKIGVSVKIIKLTVISKSQLKKFQFTKVFSPLFLLRKKLTFFSKFDIIYVNTSVILDFYLLSPFLHGKKIIHIREIPNFYISNILSYLCKFSNAEIIFNSLSTKNAFALFDNTHVIHNAFEGFNKVLNDKIINDHHSLNLLLIGRINNWKGQDFALDALSKLNQNENVVLKIIGSPFKGNEYILDELKEKVTKLNLQDKVTFIPFMVDTYLEFDWADVIIIPSLKPEPFGRIAIEGMSLKKAVIASNHGGLTEIISHNISGFLFTPGNVTEFVSYVRQYYNDRELLKIHGFNAYDIFTEKFSVAKMHESLDKVFTIN